MAVQIIKAPVEADWIGVDMDGVLVEYHGFTGDGQFGPPVAAMVEKVKKLLADGKNVRIFTSRVAGVYGVDTKMKNLVAIQEFCREHLGRVLPVTCIKDQHCREIWDDRAVQIVPNTGLTVLEYLVQASPLLDHNRI